MLVEFRHPLMNDSCEIPSGKAKLLWQHKSLSVYKLESRESKIHRLAKSACPLLVLTYSGTHVVTSLGKEHKLKQNEFIFIPALTEAEVRGDPEAESILVQIR